MGRLSINLRQRFNPPWPAVTSFLFSIGRLLPYLDSSGIGSIVNALRISSKLGGSTKLVKPSSFVSKTFKMVGILSLFNVFDSEAEAVAACGG